MGLVGINKFLSEEGETSQLAGDPFALRLNRKAVGPEGLQGLPSFQ